MDLDFLDKIWQGLGNIGADTDKFMKREMPFDSGWGAPAAVVAAIAAPEILPMMGEAGTASGAEGLGSYMGSAGLDAGSFAPSEWNYADLINSGNMGAGSVLGDSGAGGMNGYLDSLGMDTGGFSGVGDFSTSINPATGLDWAETGSGLTGNGANTGYSSMNDYMNQAGIKTDGFKPSAAKPSFQQLLGKQLMSGNLSSLGGSKGSFQHQDTPVQRQAAFAQTPAPLQVQNKDSDIAALIAALKKKDLG
jgi:hypothetical protein